MAMAATEYPGDQLADAADQVDVPQGYRVEIIEGNIIVSPTPLGPHSLITMALQYELKATLPTGHAAVQNVTLVLPQTSQRYIPDLAVLPREILRQEIWKFPIDAAALVAEVTSPGNAQTDRVAKLRGYARSHVPAYLLIDRDSDTVTLFTEPENGLYRRDVKVPFGDKIELPEPFSGEIDTSEFA